jgi:DNA-binding response OmpR family regulator
MTHACETLGSDAEPAGASVTQIRSRILVADDNEDILRLIALSLRLAGHEVLLARDGAEALELAIDQGPDLALLDVRMPNLTGHDVLRRIRESVSRRFPVILVSAMADEKAIARGRREGADAYITKPFSPAQLVREAEAALAREALSHSTA